MFVNLFAFIWNFPIMRWIKFHFPKYSNATIIREFCMRPQSIIKRGLTNVLYVWAGTYVYWLLRSYFTAKFIISMKQRRKWQKNSVNTIPWRISQEKTCINRSFFRNSVFGTHVWVGKLTWGMHMLHKEMCLIIVEVKIERKRTFCHIWDIHLNRKNR